MVHSENTSNILNPLIPSYGTKYSFHLFAGAGGGILGDLLMGREIIVAPDHTIHTKETI